MSVVQPVQRYSKSYREGMVLGLTMAETLLLLVFCLLMAAASVVAHKSKELDEAQAQQETLRDDLREARNRAEVMQSQMPGGVITDDWKHLVRDYPHIERLKQAGVPLKEAADNAYIIAQVLKAQKDGLVDDDITGAIEVGGAVKEEFKSARGEVPKSEEIISILREGMQAKTASTNPKNDGKHKWPPIISLSEAEGNYFATGKAVLSEKFRADLKGKIMDELLQNINAYPEVNVIEVVGHTDERSVGGQSSSLDAWLMPVLQNKESVARLKPADNAGLGLARAVSVTQVLLADERLARFKGAILPYSAAQLVNVNDSLVINGAGGDVKERRRIEIRLRQSERFNVPIATPAPPTVSAYKKKLTAAPRGNLDEVDTTLEQPQPSPQAALPDSTNPKPRPETGIKTPFGWFFRN